MQLVLELLNLVSQLCLALLEYFFELAHLLFQLVIFSLELQILGQLFVRTSLLQFCRFFSYLDSDHLLVDKLKLLF